jgi:hypothetical protein
MNVLHFEDVTLKFRTAAMFVSTVLYVMYTYISALSPYQFSPAHFEWFFSYRHKTERYRKCSHDRHVINVHSVKMA